MKASTPYCYMHLDREARGGCVLCGKSICSNCSNWVAENVYMCPNCWQQTSPTREETGAPKSVFLPKVLYFSTAAVIVVLGAWYVFGTFVAPRMFTAPYP